MATRKSMKALLTTAMKEEACKFIETHAEKIHQSFQTTCDLNDDAEFVFKIPIVLVLEAESRHKVGVNADGKYGITVMKKAKTAGQVVSDRDERTLFNQGQCLNCQEPVKNKGDELCPICQKLDPGQKEQRRKKKSKGASKKPAAK